MRTNTVLTMSAPSQQLPTGLWGWRLLTVPEHITKPAASLPSTSLDINKDAPCETLWLCFQAVCWHRALEGLTHGPCEVFLVVLIIKVSWSQVMRETVEQRRQLFFPSENATQFLITHAVFGTNTYCFVPLWKWSFGNFSSRMHTNTVRV